MHAPQTLLSAVIQATSRPRQLKSRTLAERTPSKKRKGRDRGKANCRNRRRGAIAMLTVANLNQCYGGQSHPARAFLRGAGGQGRGAARQERRGQLLDLYIRRKI